MDCEYIQGQILQTKLASEQSGFQISKEGFYEAIILYTYIMRQNKTQIWAENCLDFLLGAEYRFGFLMKNEI